MDVDYTLIGVDNSLRPGVKELFQRLRDDGHKIYIWSGVGIRWTEMRRNDLQDMVEDCLMKPIDHFEQGLIDHNIPVRPDFVVDDYPGIVGFFGGICIRPYFFANQLDTEMERVYSIIQDYLRDGTSEDSAYRARNGKTTY